MHVGRCTAKKSFYARLMSVTDTGTTSAHASVQTRRIEGRGGRREEEGL